MNIKPIGKNQTELRMDNGNVILFSYEQPVAAYNLRGHDVGGFPLCKTEKKWSATTSRHISNWTGSNTTPTRPQSFFDGLN
jgi:hypothetical protein